MDPKARALLYDIQQAGTLVERFSSGKSFDEYVADPLLCSGVERQLEIIGEALNRLAKIDSGEDHGPPAHHCPAQHLGSWLCQGRPSGDLEYHRAQPPLLRREVDALMRKP